MVPGTEPKEEWARGYQGFAEADAGERERPGPVEVPSKMMVHEMEAPHVTHEATGNDEFRGEGDHASKGRRP